MQKYRHTVLFLLLVLCAVTGTVQTADAATIYVNLNAPGSNDGSSWTDAYTALQSALGAALAGDTIWVAAGTYTPTADTDRSATFQLASGVALFGGFAGTESVLSERDWTANLTTLSGDIGTVDVATDNSYHVVTGSGTDATAVLDGFTIADGRASGTGDDGLGGGITNQSGAPTIRNTIIRNNYGASGGGMHTDGGSPVLVNVVFANNTAGNAGGAMNNNNGASPTLTNVSVSNNSANFGGGIRNNAGSDPVIVNTILWGNSAIVSGNEIYNNSSTPVISYSLIKNCGGSGAGWVFSLGTDNGHNIDSDPLFVDAPAGDLRLNSPASGALNAGYNNAPNLPATDLDGNPRIIESIVDIGAYELDFTCPPGPVIYVDVAATGANDGTSWSDAYTDLAAALGSLGCPSITEVWVAAGTYEPTQGTNRSLSFLMESGVALLGGFSGTETTVSERDWIANPTILSGDIGVPADSTDNSYHVVIASGADSTAVLDGFIVERGYADGSGSDGNGGGLYMAGGNPVVTNVIIRDNYAASGGGMHTDNCDPALTNVVFTGNRAGNAGGAMNNYNGGTPVLTNVSISGNSANFGGGIRNNISCHTVIINTILWGNSAATNGNELYNNASTPVISYSIIEGSGGSGAGWNVPLGTDAGGNIDANPLFVDAAAGDLHLASTSSAALNAGTNGAPNLPATDLDGNTRVLGGTVDIGAYELAFTCPPGPVIYVDAAATGANTGTSWNDAFTELTTALVSLGCPSITQIWVAAGTYLPTSGTNRSTSFRLANNVAIYGGFAGTESSLGERDLSVNKTILSGDIGAPADSTDNSYHVISANAVDSTAVLDGFIIMLGKADGTGANGQGAGLYNLGGSPVLSNLVFTRNYAVSGGGIYNDAGNPAVTNCVFYGNAAGNVGGGMNNTNGSSPALTNVTFSQNSASFGGGMRNNLESNPVIINTILWNNDATSSGDEIYNNSSTPVISYSLIDGSDGSGGGWNTTLGTDAGNNLDDDPLFVDAAAGNLRLSGPASPAFSAGSNAAPNLPALDLDSNSRIIGGTVDMGAYELAAPASMSVAPSPLLFGGVPANQTTCDTLVIANDGGATCTIAGIMGCESAPFSLDTSMTDHTLSPGETTRIAVCVSPADSGADSCTVTVVSDAWNTPVTVQVKFDLVTSAGSADAPAPFEIVSISPNPFNPSTTIYFTLPAEMDVSAEIWSVTGALVRVLAEGERFPSGENRISWDGRTETGGMAASGIYFIRVRSAAGMQAKRAVLLK